MLQFYIKYYRKKLFMSKPRIIILVLILLTLPTLLPFFNSRFFYTQDYIFIARLQQMSTALTFGQFPVRWAPDLRYGEPIFNFYTPLPYYIGAVIHNFGFDFIWAAKILFMLSAILSATAMYLFAKYLFGQKGGILAAVLYTYAPYKAVDMYVRGSLSETWAFIFFPLIFYSSVLLVKQIKFKNIVFLSLSLAGLALTHNVTTLMFLPFLGLWWVYLILRGKKWKAILQLLLAAILGLGLSAFFLLPAFFEKSLIQTKYLTVGYFDFRIHFVAIRQFFSLFWGYGSSTWGPVDGLSFQVGLVNIAILAIAFVLAVIYRKDRNLLELLIFLGISFIFSIFLTHNKSDFIWEAIPNMAFIQFPWRFLGISIFIVSLTGGAITPYLKNRLFPVYLIIIIAAIVSTLSYFKPKEYVDDNFFDKFLNSEKMHQGIDLTKDYLPIWVLTVDDPMLNYPEAKSGKIEVKKFEKKGIKAESGIKVLSDSLIEMPITYFPGWEVKANSQLIPQSLPSKMGLIRFHLPPGDYKIAVEFKDTLIRTVGNMVSLSSVLLILIILMFKRYKLR